MPGNIKYKEILVIPNIKIDRKTLGFVLALIQVFSQDDEFSLTMAGKKDFVNVKGGFSTAKMIIAMKPSQTLC